MTQSVALRQNQGFLVACNVDMRKVAVWGSPKSASSVRCRLLKLARTIFGSVS